jgi:hypothetical protein
LASRLAEQKDVKGAERVYGHLEQGAPAHLQAAILAGRVASDVAAAAERIQQALTSDDPVLFGQGAAILAHQAPKSVVAEVLTDFANWQPAVQRALLGQRWTRVPEQGRKLALAAIESEQSEVRADGLMLLSHVGSADDIVTMAEMAAQQNGSADAARHALRHLNA